VAARRVSQHDGAWHRHVAVDRLIAVNSPLRRRLRSLNMMVPGTRASSNEPNRGVEMTVGLRFV